MNLFWRRVFISFIAALFAGAALGLILGNMAQPKTSIEQLVNNRPIR